MLPPRYPFLFFFNDTATTEIYPLSLHDALPISEREAVDRVLLAVLGSPDPYGRQLDGMGGGISSLSKAVVIGPPTRPEADVEDRKSTRLNSSHANISYAVFCLKKKK